METSGDRAGLQEAVNGVAHIKAEYILPKNVPLPKLQPHFSVIESLSAADASDKIGHGSKTVAGSNSDREKSGKTTTTGSGKIIRGRNAKDLGIEAVPGKLQFCQKNLSDVENVLQKDVMIALRKRTYDFIEGTDVKNRKRKMEKGKNADDQSKKAKKKKRKAAPTYCFKWYETKTCVYGDKCRFRHVNEIPKWEPSEGDGTESEAKPKEVPESGPPAAAKLGARGTDDNCAESATSAESAISKSSVASATQSSALTSNGDVILPASDQLRDQLVETGIPVQDLSKGKYAVRVEGTGSATDHAKISHSTSNNETPALKPVASAAPTFFAERKTIDFSRKVYIAPLTTLGNLPFRRVMKDFGADITCGEMAIGVNLLKAQTSEWTLLRRHKCEDIFGVQIAGCNSELMDRLAQVLEREVNCDFVDLNMGCPIDFVCKKGMGSKLMCRLSRVQQICRVVTKRLSCPMTLKIRTGWSSSEPIADKMLRKIPLWNAEFAKGRTGGPAIQAVTIHGRSRLQRYKNLADWDYIRECARAQASVQLNVVDGNSNSNESRRELASFQSDSSTVSPKQHQAAVIGNGDVYSFTDWNDALASGELTTCMLARGALIKPWLPTEIKEQRHWDISSEERLNILRDFVKYGLDYWGSDSAGISRCRRFLLEWLSFLYRYIPLGILERVPHKMNERPPKFRGRNDLETLMASGNVKDWIVLTQLAGLPPPPEGSRFVPKHKANAYADNSNSGLSASLLEQHKNQQHPKLPEQNQDDAPPAAKRVKIQKVERSMKDWG